MRSRLVILLVVMVMLAACSAPTPTPRPIGPTATERPFPTFGPTRTPKSTRTPRPTVTPTATETAVSAPAGAPTEAATVSPTEPSAAGTSETGKSATVPTGPITRAQAPALLRSALIKAGVNDPQVYWFTFDEGSHEQALMVQYASPLRWQDGYNEMLRAAKQTLGRYYLQIDPPLYTAFVVATDLTGTSDAVQRLRRYAPEKLARGEIGAEDFLNNYFEPEQVSIKCAADGACIGKMATPFPPFHIPSRFLTRTPPPP